MKLIKSIILILSFIIFSCENNSKKINNKELNELKNLDNINHDSINQENLNQENSNELNNNHIEIDLLGLKLGATMPEKIDGYVLIKSVNIVEEGHEEPVVKVLENGKEVFQLSFAYDLNKEKFTENIGEILIFSDKFRTKEGIGVNSTIEDFITVYKEYFIWYTYISDNFIIEFKKSNIQFLLNEKNYIGKNDLMDGDMVILKKDDFTKNSKIKAIRIF